MVWKVYAALTLARVWVRTRSGSFLDRATRVQKIRESWMQIHLLPESGGAQLDGAAATVQTETIATAPAFLQRDSQECYK